MGMLGVSLTVRCIRPPGIGVQDFEECRSIQISRRRAASKGISEARMRVRHGLDASAEDHPACDDDEQQDDDLDGSNHIHEPHTGLRRKGVYACHKHNDSDGDAALFPLAGVATAGHDDIGGEDYAAGSREAKQDGLHGEHDGRKEARAPVHGLEVDLFASAARVHAAELQPDHEAAVRQDETEHPEHQGRADTADSGGDGRWCREDACSYDATDSVTLLVIWRRLTDMGKANAHQEGCRKESKMPSETAICRLFEGQFPWLDWLMDNRRVDI